ncbi:HAD family hydrolase [Frankia sp. Cppng1_Ct_nod]|uniref:HAD family hydrolase n=1 Tax=Frankia sp. Cppng1_Ct_nod TaxID=2897162 RepID=UPI001041AAE8|nr:HAD family hydrolase [Frankia sp. Cppng1_Ct_nod]
MSHPSGSAAQARPAAPSPAGARSFWVAFDLGGTLVCEDVPPLTPITESDVAGLGVTSVEFNNHLFALLGMLFEAETAPGERQTPASEIIDGYLAKHLPTCSRAVVEQITWQLVGGDDTRFLVPLPGALELLADLHRAGIQIVALSNSSLPLSFVRRVLDASGILAFLTMVVLSSECGWRKPSPEAFACLVREAGIDAADTVVFVGNDVAKDIVAAHAYGFLPILVGQDVPATTGFQAVADLLAAGEAVMDIHRAWRTTLPAVAATGHDSVGGRP